MRLQWFGAFYFGTLILPQTFLFACVVYLLEGDVEKYLFLIATCLKETMCMVFLTFCMYRSF
jgi:hypothetical protein